jgi:hypothetical protein
VPRYAVTRPHHTSDIPSVIRRQNTCPYTVQGPNPIRHHQMQCIITHQPGPSMPTVASQTGGSSRCATGFHLARSSALPCAAGSARRSDAPASPVPASAPTPPSPWSRTAEPDQPVWCGIPCDRCRPLLLPQSLRVTFRQRQRPPHRLVVLQIVVVTVQPVLVARQPPAQPLTNGSNATSCRSAPLASEGRRRWVRSSGRRRRELTVSPPRRIESIDGAGIIIPQMVGDANRR